MAFEIQNIGQQQQVQSPLDTFNQILMMKKQASDRQKEQDRAHKEEMARLERQFELQKMMTEFKIDAEKKADQQKMEDQAAFMMNRVKQVKPQLEDIYRLPQDPAGRRLLPGQQMPVSEMGQNVIPNILGAMTAGINVPPGIFPQGMKMETEEEKMRNDYIKAQMEADAKRRADETRRLGINTTADTADEDRALRDKQRIDKKTADDADRALRDKQRIDRVNISNGINATRLKIAEYLGENSNSEKVKQASTRIVEMTAKNIAGQGNEVTDDHRIEAIVQLSTMDPKTFGSYLDSIEDKPSTFMGIPTGGTEKQFKQPGAVSPSPAKPKSNWEKY